MAEETRVVPRCTNEQFFQICELIRNKRKEVLKTIHRRADMVVWINQQLGFQVGLQTVERVLKLLKIELEKLPKKRGCGVYATEQKNRTRILAKSLLRLYKKLGEVPPQDLEQLIARLEGTALPLENPIPVSSVANPKTIPVVTPNPRPNEPR